MIDAAELTPDTAVLEIGPGHGALTGELLKTGNRVIAIEKDDALYAELKDTFASELTTGGLTLLHADALDVTPESLGLQTRSFALIANIPFNITGLLIRQWLTARPQPQSVVLLVQKEVGQRICSRAGKESILSLSVKAYGQPSYICTVRAGSFFPRPKVDCAVIAITNISRNHFTNPKHEKRYFELVKAGFSSKRKQLKGNLAPVGITEEALMSGGIDPQARAETLSLEAWLCLSQITSH